MDMGTIHGIYTLVFMFAFIGMAVWVFWPKRKKTYDDAAALPFREEQDGKPDPESRRQD